MLTRVGAMDRQEAFRKFQATAADLLDLDAAAIVPEARFAEDLCVDSLGFVELTLALEDAFSIKIPDPDPDDVATVGAAFDYVAKVIGV